MENFLGNRKVRDVLLQAMYLIIVAGVVIAALVIANRTMQAQNITFSWNFLEYATGWSISFSLLPYGPGSTYATALAAGLVNTLLLGSISTALALIIGTFMGVARTANNKLVSLLGSTYVQIFRNIPLLLQAFFWYSLVTHLPNARNAIALPGSIFISNRGLFLPSINTSTTAYWLIATVVLCAVFARIFLARKMRHQGKQLSGPVKLGMLLITVGSLAAIVVLCRLPELPLISLPELKGLRFEGGMAINPELSAAIIAISLFGGAFVAEVVRAGLGSIPGGQVEAAASLGLTPWQTFRQIRFPLAIRIIMPTMTNQIIWLMKATTIGIAIGFSDFFAVIATSITNTGQTIALIFILIIGFWAINLSISQIMNLINRSIEIPGREKQ